MDRGLLEALEEGGVLIVPTKRLQRTVRRVFDEAQYRLGRACWPSPEILPMAAWAHTLWESSWPEEALVPDPVALALWEEVVGEDAEALDQGGLLDVATTAEQAHAAFELMHLYEIPFGGDAAGDSEGAAFGRWLRRFEATLGERGWVAGSTLPGRAADAIASGAVAPPETLLLLGFDEIAPVHARLLRAVETRGGRVRRLPTPCKEGQVARVGARDPREEVRCAARWVRRRLEQTGAPDERVAVVALNLEPYAVWVEEIFAAELAPACVLPGMTGDTLPFDVSFGAPLSREPIVATAIDLLGVGRRSVEWEVWTSLLRSPFWGGSGEEIGRAALDAHLSRLRGTAWRAREVAQRAREANIDGTADALDTVADLLEEDHSERRPSRWVDHFVALLQKANWGTARTLSSREFQARERFREALTHLRGFDGLGRAVTRGWALDRLRKLCSAPFRPEAPPAAVPVIGALEAGGLEFDHLWVLGLHAGTFPPEAHPNPFLPSRLQVDCGVRQASPQAQLAWARRTLQRLITAADEVVLSHPGMWKGTQVLPSPLIQGVPLGEPPMAEPASLVAAMRRSPVELDVVHDESAPLEVGEPARGGTALLADQAACPFRAFALHRLWARPLEVPDRALDALERGIGVHEALCAFWGAVESLDALQSMTADALEEAIRSATQAGLAALERGRPKFPERMRELEGRRIGELLREWIGREREREPFTVAVREGSREVALGGLRLSVRVDRIDVTRGGEQLVLDYKTGRPKPARWFEERPREPQLPLYAVASPEARGVGYAVLRRGECALYRVWDSDEGLQSSGPLPEDVRDWNGLVAAWRERLGRIAEEILGGRADVSPLEGEACRFCELPALCRIEEQESDEEDSE